MARVRVIVEGQTEEQFVLGPLREHLAVSGIYLEPTLIGASGGRGGRVTFDRVTNDVIRTLKQDHTVFCTTLIDFYGLGSGFPPIPPPSATTSQTKATFLESALLSRVAAELPYLQGHQRFIPYIQLHEFEALLFSDPAILAAGMFRPEFEGRLQAIRNTFPTPEDINDGPTTAPSKRLLQLDVRYAKVISGAIAAETMGIARIKQECPRFREWTDDLGALNGI